MHDIFANELLQHLLCSEKALWKKKLLLKNDEVAKKNILCSIGSFYEHLLTELEQLVEYFEVLRNHGQLKLIKSFSQQWTTAEKFLKDIFKICRDTLIDILVKLGTCD